MFIHIIFNLFLSLMILTVKISQITTITIPAILMIFIIEARV